MKSVEYKAPGGKMIKLDIEFSGSRISYIKITGDFFIHPEESIIEIEKILTNVHVSQAEGRLKDHVEYNKILLVGVNVEDMAKVIQIAKAN